MKELALSFVTAALAMAAVARQSGVCKWDPAMAERTAQVDERGIKWIDGKCLPIEGRAFDDVANYFDRLPANVSTNVNAGVRDMKSHTSGMQFRFRTTSDTLHFRWEPSHAWLEMDHMPASGVSGIDIYTQGENGRWIWRRTGRIYPPKSGAYPCGRLDDVTVKPGTPICVNLPLYNGIRSFRLGVAKDAKIEALGPRKSGVDRPVVFYGTSITQGGCASRPGMSFVNIVGRDLDVPVVNLGFSGSGWMEYELSEHLAHIDASCYVLDCLPNMGTRDGGLPLAGRNVEENYEPFVRNLRRLRPDVPIVLAEISDVFCNGPTPKDEFVRTLYGRLMAEGWKNLVYLPKNRLYVGDGEGTVDGRHPNDHGMVSLAAAFGQAVRTALGERLKAVPPPFDPSCEPFVEDITLNEPDYVVYRPRSLSDASRNDRTKVGDAVNEHFTTVYNPKTRAYLAFWTQATWESGPDAHISFSRSTDGGRTWSKPRVLWGSPTVRAKLPTARWQLPMVSRSGRTYCVWNQRNEMLCAVSFDDGDTWTEPAALRKNYGWCSWQRPLRLGRGGRYLTAASINGKTEFLQFENIDDDPRPQDVKVSRFMRDGARLQGEEASIVKLPDGRLFCVMRSLGGHPLWSQSRDEGVTWSPSQVLRDAFGEAIEHPRSPCPMYDYRGDGPTEGRYFAFFTGVFDPLVEAACPWHGRGPLRRYEGRFDPAGEQPVRFVRGPLFLRRSGKTHYGNSCYSSYTFVDGKGILWFPDSKYYLLGKDVEPVAFP